MSDSVLYDFAAEFLAAAVAGIDVANRPARQVIEPGPDFSHDNCDLIAIELQRQYPSRITRRNMSDRPLPGEERDAFVRVAVYQITLVINCIPALQVNLSSASPPDIEAINAASLRVLTDGWDAKVGVHDLLVGDDRPTCERASVGDLVPFGPGGGQAGVRFTVTVQF